MLSLRVEIVLCLFAVASLGLLTGWMMQRASGARRLRAADAVWSERHAELERSASRDEERLEEQLQSLGEELRTLATENRARLKLRGLGCSGDLLSKRWTGTTLTSLETRTTN